ncbi:MAG: superoxide dismutase family protein [Candidatus Rokuibacteriota bacterium]
MRLGIMMMLSLWLAGCAALTQQAGTGATATAELVGSDGAPVGTATLTEVSDGVRIVMEVRSIAPGPHGVHIHDVGRCDRPGFTSAGGHFNPGSKEHGILNPKGAHAGDLPNVTVAADGTGRLETLTNRVTLGSGPTSIFDADGSALVVHAGPDDFRTDPTGNSGNRIACGAIVKGGR